MSVQFFREFFRERSLNSIQDNVGRVVDAVNRVPFMDGEMLSVTITASANMSFRHKLKRMPQGVLPTLLPANFNVWVTDMDKTHITIDNDAADPFTIKLWVF